LPDCLIADLQMPEMTGLELQFVLARRGVQIPIIITAHDEAGMRERCKSAGAIAYPAKPVSDTSLFAAIDSADKRSGGYPTFNGRRTAASMESIGRMDRGSSRWCTPAAQSSGRPDQGQNHPGSRAGQPPGAAPELADKYKMRRCARSNRQGRDGS
jgi:DNA-binding NarL/FixJ family response regulator